MGTLTPLSPKNARTLKSITESPDRWLIRRRFTSLAMTSLWSGVSEPTARTGRSWLTSEAQHLSLAAPISVSAPTGDIIPDGFGGVLFSIRSSSIHATQQVEGASDQFVYRVTQEASCVQVFVAKYSGPLHDEMVLGEQDLGFATRGSILMAETSRWKRSLAVELRQTQS